MKICLSVHICSDVPYYWGVALDGDPNKLRFSYANIFEQMDDVIPGKKFAEIFKHIGKYPVIHKLEIAPNGLAFVNGRTPSTWLVTPNILNTSTPIPENDVYYFDSQNKTINPETLSNVIRGRQFYLADNYLKKAGLLIEQHLGSL